MRLNRARSREMRIASLRRLDARPEVRDGRGRFGRGRIKGQGNAIWDASSREGHLEPMRERLCRIRVDDEDGHVGLVEKQANVYCSVWPKARKKDELKRNTLKCYMDRRSNAK